MAAFSRPASLLNCPNCGHKLESTPSTLLAMFSADEIAGFEDRFPGVDLEWEAQKCTTWWVEKGRQMKRPRSAFLNWLERAGSRNGTGESPYATNARAKQGSEYY